LQGFSELLLALQQLQIELQLVMKNIPCVFSGFQTHSTRCRFATELSGWPFSGRISETWTRFKLVGL